MYLISQFYSNRENFMLVKYTCFTVYSEAVRPKFLSINWNQFYGCLSVSLPNIIILHVGLYGVEAEPHADKVGMEKKLAMERQ